jgi:hypothetical protein
MQPPEAGKTHQLRTSLKQNSALEIYSHFFLPSLCIWFRFMRIKRESCENQEQFPLL